MPIGYCTNCHPGVTLEAIKRSLMRFTLPVKQAVYPTEDMPIGLWLPRVMVDELMPAGVAEGFADWLGERGLFVNSVNAFPFDDFHQPVVKHAVYEPDWSTPARSRYTLDACRVLARLMPPHVLHGSVSTLPVSWRNPDGTQQKALDTHAAGLLLLLIDPLDDLLEKTGRLIHVDLEPEPGCRLSTASDTRTFFEALHGVRDDETLRRHLRVCFDVCHEALVDPPGTLLEMLTKKDIRLGKVQLSSAPRVRFDGLSIAAARRQRKLLEALPEPRFLHQTGIEADGVRRFYSDLPEALLGESGNAGTWTVHFHVPIHRAEVAGMSTTQNLLQPAIAAAHATGDQPIIEVETYTHPILNPMLNATEGSAASNPMIRELIDEMTFAAQRVTGTHP